MSRLALGLLLLTLVSGWLASGCGESARTGGEVAPAFDLPLVGGGRVSLDALRGQTVLLDFWATWCEPCVLEIPELNALQPELQEKD